MADIEERCAKWVQQYISAHDLSDFGSGIEDPLTDAYMAGVAQTQRDYARYHDAQQG